MILMFKQNTLKGEKEHFESKKTQIEVDSDNWIRMMGVDL